MSLALLALLACQRAAEPEAETSTAPRPRYTPQLTVHERAAPPPAPALAPGQMRHAVLIVVDTLREDALARARTPRLDGLVALGAQRKAAWAPSTWTAPSVISLMSAMPVRQHGWDFSFPKQMQQKGQVYPPLPSTPLLAEVLGEAGVQAVGLYGNRLLGQGLGYGRGFQRWEWGDDEALIRRAVEEIGGWDPEERHFLYLHLMGPHHPLEPSRASRERWGLKRKDLGPHGSLSIPRKPPGTPGEALESSVYYRAYHAVIEDTDARLGRVLDALRPHMDQTALVLTSDHGELLGEHGAMGHAAGLYEPLTRVPMLAWNCPPLAELPRLEQVPGLLTEALGVAHRWPDADRGGPPWVSQREGALAVSPDGRLKGIWGAEGGAPTAFDLRADPSETSPLAEPPPELRAAHQAFLGAVPAGQLHAAEGELSAAMRQALEELGYLDAEGGP